MCAEQSPGSFVYLAGVFSARISDVINKSITHNSRVFVVFSWNLAQYVFIRYC